MEFDKTFFVPGEKVKCSKLSNSPEMYVLRKKELTFKSSDQREKILQGIVCRWFTDNGFVQEAVFNTKDIFKI